MISDDYLDNMDRDKYALKMYKSYNSNGFIVAVVNDLVVGFCRYIFDCDSPYLDELSALYVRPDLKGNGIYGMFVSASLYHGGAFTGILRVIFVFLVPSLLLGAVPVEIIKSFSIIKCLILLLFSILWLIISIWFFYRSIRRYESNSFFGFGG